MDKPSSFTALLKTRFPLLDGFAALLLLGLLAFGVTQLWRSTATIELASIPVTLTDMLEGHTVAVFADQVEKALPARHDFIGLSNGLRYRLTGGTGEQVRRGHAGWFFLAEELQFSPEAEPALQTRVQLIAALSRKLAAEGVELVVALVPDKARVYAGELPDGYPAYQTPRYQAGLSLLQSNGVRVVNLMSPMIEQARGGADLYYRTDTHWNQAGANLVAHAIAQEIKAAGAHWPKTAFETVADGPLTERPGDLTKLMGVNEVMPALRPDFDREEPLVTRKVGEASSAASLFGEVQLPVVLVGTSYSLRANFQGFLHQALATEILNVARDGGGFLQSVSEYLGDESYANNKPQVLVWELPERFLTLPLKADQQWRDKFSF